jgi:exodeoxyribonuclease V alpha subunit
MDNLTKIRGQVERITFVNEENGFTLAKMKVPDEKDLVSVVGSLAILLTRTLAYGQK